MGAESGEEGGGRDESGQSFRSLRVARGYTINRFAVLAKPNP